METNQNTNIVKNYQRFFVFVFKYLFLLAAIILSAFFFQSIFINKTVSNTGNDPFAIQKIKLIGAFDKFLTSTVKDNDVQIYILQGPLVIQNKFLVSQDNLITYKGFVVPKNLAIATTLPLKQLSYFDTPNYVTGELAQFVNNFILTTQDNVSHGLQNTQIPLADGLISTFNLSCLGESVVFAKTCGHYLNTFLDSFFVYQIHMDYAGLQKIFTATTQTTYRARFCEGMKKYLLYTNDTSAQLSDIFDQCGSGYTQFYKRMKSFVDIQQQLEDKYISPDIYKDQLLNVYKLLSYQQILYQDFQELKIRKNEYTLYLDYVQEAIKRHALPQFYIDEVYWFNTYYLKPTLLTTRYDRRWSGIKEGEIMQVVKSIDAISMGNDLSNVSGLTLLVSNPDLVQLSNATTIASETLSLQEQISKRMAAITYFTVAQSTISNNIVQAQGYFLVNSKKISSKLTLTYANDTFIVKDIELTNYPELGTVLQGLVKTRDTSIGEFFAALSKNLPLYENTNAPVTDLLTMCSQIRDLESGLGIQVSTCTQDVLVVNKIIDGTNITYTFLLQNFFPTDITVSDPAIQTNIKNAVSEKNYTPKTLAEVVGFVLSVKPSSAQVHWGSTNTLLTLQDFQEFLGIDAKDIAEKNGVILVDFIVSKVNFIANYDIIRHKIIALYFKDILDNGQPLPIREFALALDKSNQDAIDSFVKDPISYIKIIDLTAWKNYTERKKK